MTKTFRAGAAAILLAACAPAAPAQALTRDAHYPAAGRTGKIAVFARFYGPTPIEVAVSPRNRIFMSFPCAFDPGPFSVGEIKAGRAVPYPSAAINRLDGPQANHLVSVQGMTVDAQNRLWLLDTGIIGTKPTQAGGPKLVCVDLNTNQIVKKIIFTRDVAGPNAYLNDVRVDLAVGTAGTAFITDSSEKGPNGIVVVDLATGQAVRRLNDHPSTKYEPNFIPVVEGERLLKRRPGQPGMRDRTGADGLTLSGDGKNLFYGPNEGVRIYAVPVKTLADASKSDEDVNNAVKDYGPKPGPADGIEADSANRVYVTDYVHDAIWRRLPSGKYELVAQDPRLVWPDAIAFSTDGFMYFTADQLDRQKKYHNGHDLRRRPVCLWRMRTDSQPVFLK